MRRTILSETPVRAEVHDGGEQEGDDQSVRAAEQSRRSPAAGRSAARAAAPFSRRLPYRDSISLPIASAPAAEFQVQCPAFRRKFRETDCRQLATDPRRPSRPATSAARQGSAAISTCSCAACAPSPIGSEAVERRHAHRRGEVAVRPAAGRSLEQLASEGGGHVAREREEPADGWRCAPAEAARNRL